LEVCAIAFSADGKRLVSCGNLPDFRMCIWDIEAGTVVCDTKLEMEISQVVFDPLDSTQLCVFSEEDAKLSFWRIDTGFTSANLIETYVGS
jgi:WD40 repeat protein